MIRVAPQHARILLLGNDARVLLAIIRSLGRRGDEVHVGWCPPDSPALASRYVTCVHSIPAYSPCNNAWKTALIYLLQKEHFDLVIPCHDPALIPLQRHRVDFEPWASIVLLNDQAFSVFFDKIRTFEMARSLNIPVPTSIVGNQVRSLQRRSQTLKYPLFVKPRSSITEHDVLNKRAVQQADTPVALSALLEGLDVSEGILIQESFPGVGVGVEVLARDGQICLALQHRRLRESMAGGSTYRETVPLAPPLRRATSKLIRKLNHTGVAMMEFRVNPRDGTWVLLEINARFWGSLPLATFAGMDFPAHLVNLYLAGQRTFDDHYQFGIRSRNLVEDLRCIKQSNDPPFTRYRKLIFELAALAVSHEHLDMLASDDWRPQFTELSHLGRSLWQKLNQRVHTSANAITKFFP